MSQEHPMPGNTVAPRRQISIPFGRIGRPPVLNVIGLPELIGLAGAALLAVIVVFAYLYFYVPASVRLKSSELYRTAHEWGPPTAERYRRGSPTPRRCSARDWERARATLCLCR